MFYDRNFFFFELSNFLEFLVETSYMTYCFRSLALAHQSPFMPSYMTGSDTLMESLVFWDLSNCYMECQVEPLRKLNNIASTSIIASSLPCELCREEVFKILPDIISSSSLFCCRGAFQKLS